ncbi:MAG: hypothetical protein IPO21_21245 [Bacteroidales bacterium]|nr:hypothetical protein [Bacteroidales bacterium]
MPIFIVFLLISILGNGQTLKFDHLGISQNINNKYIECLHEDSYGFIWIGTNTSLYRYNGQTAKEYQNLESDTNSLAGNGIFSIAEDKYKNVYIAHRFEGLSIYNRYNDNFSRLEIPDAIDSVKLAKNSIREIFFDKENTLWVLSSYGIGKRKNNSADWQWFTECTNTESFINKIAFRHTIARDGSIWFTLLKADYLLKFNPKLNKIEQFNILEANGKPMYLNGILGITSDAQNNIWVGTGSKRTTKNKSINK